MRKAMFLTVGVSCLLAVMAAPARAQFSRPIMLKGEIPFEFVSGDRTLPAGNYSIEVTRTGVSLDANGHRLQAVIPSSIDSNNQEQRPRLLFRQYGGVYFLSQILTRSERVDFVRSRAERTLRAGFSTDIGIVNIALR
jgi:hypothetical protein